MHFNFDDWIGKNAANHTAEVHAIDRQKHAHPNHLYVKHHSDPICFVSVVQEGWEPSQCKSTASWFRASPGLSYTCCAHHSRCYPQAMLSITVVPVYWATSDVQVVILSVMCMLWACIEWNWLKSLNKYICDVFCFFKLSRLINLLIEKPFLDMSQAYYRGKLVLKR